MVGGVCSVGILLEGGLWDEDGAPLEKSWKEDLPGLRIKNNTINLF